MTQFKNKQDTFRLEPFIKGRVYVFIDAANIFYSQRTLSWKVAYAKLMKFHNKNLALPIRHARVLSHLHTIRPAMFVKED